LSSGVLSVDMAIGPIVPSGGSVPSVAGASPGINLAIVQAGGADPKAPRPSTVFEENGTSGGVSAPSAAVSVGPGGFFPNGGGVKAPSFDVLPRELNVVEAGTSNVTLFDVTAGSLPVTGGASCAFGVSLPVIGQATAVAFSPHGDLLVQSREPAALTIMPSGTSLAEPRTLALGGDSARDTGHEIFHRDAGGGIACASCHAEGAEDGHTWNFTSIGSRRTQALYVGLEGTEPFHWNGDESDLGAIMADVFVGRMGGVHQSAPRLDSLEHWLFGLTPPAPIVSAESEAALRGRELFQSAATGCTACHTGAKLTNNKTVDVGTGGKLQVPSLRGVGYRLPLMHSGCARRLEDRFDPACGGSKHGDTSQLDAARISDMVAFLRTL
jgi:mono/diheme cytochrome c family protein